MVRYSDGSRGAGLRVVDARPVVQVIDDDPAPRSDATRIARTDGLCGRLPRACRGRYPARAGGPWLWSTLVLFLFQAVVVPSGLTISVQPQRWMTI
jgi:hypothetical protein